VPLKNLRLVHVQKSNRFIELDILRALAIAMMVVYHAAFDLAAFYDFNIDPYNGGWWLLARSTAILFLLLVGVSFVISWERTRTRFKFFKRGLFILGCGMLITIATYIWDPSTYIRFGILHMIGVSVMLLPLFRKFREWNLLIAALIIYFGINIIPNSEFSILNSELLIPFGITPSNFTTLDFFPLLPWFGVVLIGLALGDFFYIRKERIPKEINRFLQLVSYPGKHALWIYLIHQPILLLFLNLLLTF